MSPVQYASDEILPGLTINKLSPATNASEDEILMQDPFDVATTIISELLSVEEQTLL
jgi:hypothetical protein